MAGLLDMFGGGASDPGALYGGLLTPQQNSALAYRGLLAAAGAFGQAAMPSRMPIPTGAALGSAAAAMGNAQDIAGQNAMKGGLLGLQGQQLKSDIAIRNALMPIAQQLMNGGGMGGQDAPAGGGLLGSPAPNAKVDDGGIGAGQLYSFLTDNGATPNEATMLTSAANSESSFRPDITHDGGIGYGLFGHNTDRLAAMRDFARVGPNDPVPWQKQALFALNELHGSESKAGGMVNAATTPEQLTDAQLAFERPNLNIAGGNRAQRLASTTEYFNKPPGAKPTQLAQANTGTATDALPEYGTRPAGAGPIPPQIPRNSAGQSYLPMGPGDSAAAGTPGAGPVITPQQAAAANAAGGNRLPVMPSNYIFGNGQVAPPGAGTISSPTAPQIPNAPAAPQGLLDRLNAASSSAAPPASLLPPQVAQAPAAPQAPPAPPAAPPQGMLAPKAARSAPGRAPASYGSWRAWDGDAQRSRSAKRQSSRLGRRRDARAARAYGRRVQADGKLLLPIAGISGAERLCRRLRQELGRSPLRGTDCGREEECGE